jgi:Dolichyl-phosphate-mannose-protein mannosyltransferase
MSDIRQDLPPSSQRKILENSALSAVKSKWELPVVVGILLIAFALRVLALNAVPPGLHHDEVIIGQVAKDILHGHLAIYFTAGYGHEPLYHYIVSGMFAALGANAFVLRLTSAFVAMLGLAVAYRFVRRIFSPTIALGTLAWMAVSLWPTFFARVGLRGITLPLLSMLTAYFLWRAFEKKQEARGGDFALAGALLGLTAYTYQGSRVFPIIFGMFFLYLWIAHSSLVARHPSSLPMSPAPPEPEWAARRIPHPSSFRNFLAFFMAAAIIAAPLVIYLTVINPSAERRVSDLSGPLNQLAAGDPSEVIHSTLNTLGMFTISGDAVPIYNVSGRPVFPEPIGAALFYIGFLICLWRWKRPAYALMLIWFFISLVPAMVTPFSPNFVRTIGVWPVPFVFCGLAMVEVGRLVNWSIGRLVNQHSAFSIQQLITGLFILVLTFNTALTIHDYFIDWPRSDYVRFWQQATWTQAVRTLNADPSSSPVAASGLSINDFDPQTFDLLGLRSDLKVKWFDCRNAILYPNGGVTTRYLSPDFFPCDADLWSRFLSVATLIAQPRWPDTGNVIFTLHQFDARATLETILSRLKSQSVFIGTENFDKTNPSGGLEPVSTPIDLSGLRLLGSEGQLAAPKPGETLEFETYWQITAPIAPPLKLFVHVTASDGTMIAQWDGLDVGIASLEAGDVFVQRHLITLPTDMPIGPYRISLGVYHSDTGQRLTANVGNRSIDSIVLGTMYRVK